MTISRWIRLKMRNAADKSCRENQNSYFTFSNFFTEPDPMVERSKAWICGRSSAEIVGSIPAGDGCFSVVGVVCCQVGLCNELITRTEEFCRLWCVVVCDLETSIMRRPRHAFSRSPTPPLNNSNNNNNKFCRKSCLLWDNVENVAQPDRPHETI
jgi:hypothetical protein